MNNTNLASLPLFEKIFTKIDAVKFIQKLEQIADSLFSIKIPLDTVLNNILTLDEKRLLLEYCKTQQINITDPVVFQKQVQMIKQALDTQPVMMMYLGFAPTVEFAKELSDWFVRNLNQKYFLEFEHKQEIIGGVVLVINGTYKNYSIKKLLDDKYRGQDLIGRIIQK